MRRVRELFATCVFFVAIALSTASSLIVLLLHCIDGLREKRYIFLRETERQCVLGGFQPISGDTDNNHYHSMYFSFLFIGREPIA